MPNLEFENNYSGIIAGVDEAGRGPLAGPVVACALILNRSQIPEGLDDSKKLSKKRRDYLFNHLIDNHNFGLGIIQESVIDQVNILQATILAMKQAISNLRESPNIVLVDGNKGFDYPNANIVPIVKGDSKSLSIAGASIIAKVTRDKIMEDLDIEFPQYNWLKNAGYGTKEHLDAIEKYGICKYHRTSFEPIKSKLLNSK
ncbi:MAG: ribonuclease HII [Rickettsiales bacterium]|nr:ribonuclease HII [Rickettsiales bacterium]